MNDPLTISITISILAIVVAACARKEGFVIALAIIAGLLINIKMVTYTDAKHRHDREPMIARAMR